MENISGKVFNKVTGSYNKHYNYSKQRIVSQLLLAVYGIRYARMYRGHLTITSDHLERYGQANNHEE